MPLSKIEVSFLGFVKATFDRKLSTAEKKEIRKIIDILDDHTALYEDDKLEYAGAVADSISRLRRELKDVEVRMTIRARREIGCDTFAFDSCTRSSA